MEQINNIESVHVGPKFGKVCFRFWLVFNQPKFKKIGSSFAGAAGVLVEEPGKAADRASVVSGSMAGVFQERFGVPHIGSVGGVVREHGHVHAGDCALLGKLEGEVLSSHVQPLLLEGAQGHLIAGVASSKDDSKCFFLDTFNLPTLVLGESTV